MAIHPTAVIAPGAKIGENVEIGPYVVIEEDCVIGDGCWIDAHVKIARYTTIGKNCRIYLGAYIGAEPQDHRFVPGVLSSTEIGDDTVLREYVTVHRSPFEGAVTRVGNHTLLMAFVHIGHDAQIGNYVTIANNTAISGHIIVEDGAVISGYVLVHQFVRIGALSMIGARSILTQDMPPFCMMDHESKICGLNIVGMRRAGIGSAARTALRKALKLYCFSGLNGTKALEQIEQIEPKCAEVERFATFIAATKRGIMPAVELTQADASSVAEA